MVDLVHSRGSKYLRIRVKFFLPSQSSDQCIKGGGEKIIPLESTPSFNVLERSSSFT